MTKLADFRLRLTDREKDDWTVAAELRRQPSISAYVRYIVNRDATAAIREAEGDEPAPAAFVPGAGLNEEAP